LVVHPKTYHQAGLRRGTATSNSTKTGAHKKQPVRDWLAENPRIKVHFTPTSASWRNLGEVWFGIIERQAIHRGTFRSVHDPTTAIKAFINGWNPRAHPFVWTKSPEQILAKAHGPTTSTTDTR
jgi:hypothetical protein